eukprot:scaffold10552_cov276-Chaetoceros_neogracile.AAC.19
MAPKKNKKKGKTQVAEDDDWDALLQAEAVTNASEAPALVEDPRKEEDNLESKEDKSPAVLDAAAAFLAASGAAPVDAGDSSGAKKKRKKKKKGAGAGGDVAAKDDSKVSSKGKLIAERLRVQREEEERILAAEEAERQRVADLEATEEAERKRIEDEKDKKKRKKQEKIERQKKEGTYMTKAQKQKAAFAQQRLEAMKAAGMVVGNKNTGEKKKKPVYGDRKKQRQKEEEEVGDDWEKEDDEIEAKENAVPEPDTIKDVPAPEPDTIKDEPTHEPVNDEWDADSGDDWDADSDGGRFDDLEAKLESIKIDDDDDDDDDEEDLIEKEKRVEVERLRKLGLERRERDRIEAEKREKLLDEQKEMKLQDQMKAQKREEGKKKREEQEKANLAARSRDDLRCPIAVIMGHVDTGKTKLLDKIRKTNVQGGEAGGITQQIGATFFEQKTLLGQTAKLRESEAFEITVPGMLVIDTPGHESFTNLRSRGSSLCDVAILVVDLMHGLEQQTIESLNMLQKRGTPFVVALNKIDRCYDWQVCPDTPIRDALKKQPEGTVSEFRTRSAEVKLQLQEKGINSNIYWEMGDDDWENSDFVPLVPTSAISGEGVQDILLLLCQMAQRKLWRQIMWHANLQCTVLEVKQIDGLGMTVDVLVVNGYLREGDKAVFCTLDGPVVAEIRGLLTPPPSRELRVKSEYIHHKEVKGALGVKLIGNGLDKVMAGTSVLVINNDDEEEDIKAEVMSDLTSIQNKLNTDKVGVMVQASTLGALEALLQFLREETKPPIPVSAVGIGGIHKRDVTRISIMNEKGKSEYATILAFDVDISNEARDHAKEMGVRIFTADIIYHLFDQFTRFMENLMEQRRQEAAAVAVFPSVVRILPQHVFNQKDPIIVGVEIVEGILKVGTPLCIPALGGLHVGKVTSIEANGKEQETARKGVSVAIRIVNEHNPTITYGRQFDSTHSLYSTLTRASINALKENFKDKLETDDWRLVVKLKKVFAII